MKVIDFKMMKIKNEYIKIKNKPWSQRSIRDWGFIAQAEIQLYNNGHIGRNELISRHKNYLIMQEDNGNKNPKL